MNNQKRQIPWNKGRKGLQVAWNKGKKLTEAHRKALRVSRVGSGIYPHIKIRGENNPAKRLEVRQKLRLKAKEFNHKNPSFKGRKHVLETKMKISKSNRGRNIGINNNMWRGGITPINEKIRKSFEYKLWREAVFKRDNYICIWCGQKGGKLNADHIKPFAFYPELRLAIDNGRTLCIDCHKKTITWGRPKK